MPFYDFKCNKCGEITERLTTVKVDEFECDCGGMFIRQFTPTNIKLLGRQKPTGFKWHPGELNPKKDRLQALQEQQEKKGNLSRGQIAEVRKLRKELNVV